MLTCQYCGLSGVPSSGDFQLDEHNIGFWCEVCDGFTYLNDKAERHRFTLILEDKSADKPLATKPDIKLAKRLSPYRYPGGKSKIIDYLYLHLQKASSKKLVSPFTGGGSFELSMLNSNIVEHLHLNDLDKGVYSLWWLIINNPEALIDRIKTVSPSHDDYFEAQSIIKAGYNGANTLDAAWSSLVVNRLAYSGISKANPLGGRNGSVKALLSRWNPTELIKKINHIHSLRDRITVTQLDAVSLIEEAYWNTESTIFIDPPYVEKGKALYDCYYTEENHRELSILLDLLHFGCPGADLVVTYDYNEWLDSIYDYPERKIIGRKYSA